MWPGVDRTQEMEQFMADEITALYTSDNSLFAIGALAVGSDEVVKD